MCVCVCVCIHAQLTYIHVYVHRYIHTYWHDCMYTYVHTYIHTYTHIFMHQHVKQQLSCHFSHVSGVQGYIGYNSDKSTIILAFRGSSNIQNWLVDFAFPLVQFDGLPPGAEVRVCVFLDRHATSHVFTRLGPLGVLPSVLSFESAIASCCCSYYSGSG
jgi:hypothetical protein